MCAGLRRRDEPTTSLDPEALPCNWRPARGFRHGPETSRVSLDEAEDGNAVRSHHHTCHPARAEAVQIRRLGSREPAKYPVTVSDESSGQSKSEDARHERDVPKHCRWSSESSRKDSNPDEHTHHEQGPAQIRERGAARDAGSLPNRPSLKSSRDQQTAWSGAGLVGPNLCRNRHARLRCTQARVHFPIRSAGPAARRSLP